MIVKAKRNESAPLIEQVRQFRGIAFELKRTHFPAHGVRRKLEKLLIVDVDDFWVSAIYNVSQIGQIALNSLQFLVDISCAGQKIIAGWGGQGTCGA